MQNRLIGTLTTFLEGIFRPADGQKHNWARWIWLLALYAGGIALWGVFFQWGKFPVTFHDWAEVTAPRLYFLKDAITHGIPPLHISNPSALGGITDRYLSIPDTFFSPQAVLLTFVSVASFVLINQILLYTVGFIGLLWFERKFSLSPMAFTVLFLLFNFNGHVLSHFAVGHDTWGGYFLFPWFVMLVISLLEGRRSWKWVASMALLLLVMLLQGSFHQFVWCLIFLGFLALASWKNFLPIVSAAVFSVGISLVRLLPPALLLSQFGNKYPYMGGYPTVGDLWSSMTTIRLPGVYTYPPYVQLSLGSWEFDLYVGLLGVAFLLVFGVYFWWKNRSEDGHFNVLALPLLAVAILSIGDVYQIVRALHIPLLDGERVSSRIISLPFVFLVILASIEFQRWLTKTRLSKPIYTAQLAILFIGAADLFKNFNTWKLANTHNGFNFSPVIAYEWFAVPRADPAYERMITIGAAGSMLAILVLLSLIWAENRGGVHLGAPAWLPKPLLRVRIPVPVTGRPRRAMRSQPGSLVENLISEADTPSEPAAAAAKHRRDVSAGD
jgi:hypothetical protein